MEGNKWCNHGQHYQPLVNFYKDKNSPDGLDYYCKCCRKSRKIARKHLELDYHRKYREQNRERRRLVSRKFNEDNKGYFTHWRKLNVDKTRFYSQSYALKKNLATPLWLTEEHKVQISEFYAHARDCEVVSGERYHVDHIVPIKGRDICGLHVPWNLQILPADINISKSNKLVADVV